MMKKYDMSKYDMSDSLPCLPEDDVVVIEVSNDESDEVTKSYTSKHVGSSPWIKGEYFEDVRDAPRNERNRFVAKVYTVVSAHLLGTATLAAAIYLAMHYVKLSRTPDSLRTPLGVTMIVAMCASLVMPVCLSFSPGTFRAAWRNYVFLTVFSIFMGVFVGCGCSMSDRLFTLGALASTPFIVGGLALYATNVPSEFTGWRLYLYAVLLVLASSIVLVLVSILTAGLAAMAHRLIWVEALCSFLVILMYTWWLVLMMQLQCAVKTTQDRHRDDDDDTRSDVAVYGGDSTMEPGTIIYSTDDYFFATIMLYADFVDLFVVQVIIGKINAIFWLATRPCWFLF